MQDQLLLLHRFLNEIMQAANEDELIRLSAKYRDALGACAEDDVLYQLWDDGEKLGREILQLKAGSTDAVRNKRIAALTAEERVELEEAEAIIDGNRFGYHFQPIVNAADGGIYSYEALMRPQSTIGLTPFHILKYAELTGRLNDIERATFMNVLTMIDSDKARFQGRKVFINSIPKTKLEADDFRHVGELLIRHSDTAVVEMTEQAEPDENELDALKERYLNMDVKIAIDDYGTGYSNVKNLLRYMPQYVKIDRSLLSDIQDNPKKRHFVREIIEFCHDNGILALAEGVETAEELRAVILLGADLIQGFYTAKPGAEIIEAIPYRIRQEIRLYQQERQDGKGQQVYAAERTERVQLERLVKEDYRCILLGKDAAEAGEVTVIGAPSLDTDIHIEAAKDFRGRVILENVHLSNVKNRPCIDLSENSDVTLVLKGENRLSMGGIRVPEHAKLRLEGDGNLYISLNTAEYYGIGNDRSSRHGELIFDQSGTVSVQTDGQIGVCIGSGSGGRITIAQGKYMLNMNGDTGVGLGALDADTVLEVCSCDFNADLSLAKGVAIGSLRSSADVHISRSSAKLYMGGRSLTAIGTIDGERADVRIDNAIVSINIRGPRCTCAGALEGNTVFQVKDAAFRVTAGGEESLPFGGFGGVSDISLLNADASIQLETEIDMEQYLSANQVVIVSGRIGFTNHGNDIAYT